jgi:hypothetical protein
MHRQEVMTMGFGEALGNLAGNAAAGFVEGWHGAPITGRPHPGKQGWIGEMVRGAGRKLEQSEQQPDANEQQHESTPPAEGSEERPTGGSGGSSPVGPVVKPPTERPVDAAFSAAMRFRAPSSGLRRGSPSPYGEDGPPVAHLGDVDI